MMTRPPSGIVNYSKHFCSECRYSDDARLWNRVEKTETCWLWHGSIGKNGYGITRYKGKTMTAHRMAWTLTHGEIPDGLCILHKCDVRVCVNPDHLFLGTYQDNATDAYNKGRTARGLMLPQTKLTPEAVLEIRAIWNTGTATQFQLGEFYGVNQKTVSKIVNRQRWAHI